MAPKMGTDMIPSFTTALDSRETVRLAARGRRIALGLTQSELAARSGVPLGTLKRFERLGEVSFSTLLLIAEALDALEAFQDLFPLPDATSLDELDHQARLPTRVRRRG